MARPEPSAATSQTPTYRATLAIIATYAVLTLGLLTVCQERGPELPGFNAAFAAGVFVADLATAFLLLIMFRREATRSVLLLAAAFLFSALMALAYLLTSPGAVTSGRPLVGTAQTISWVYNSWIAGFSLVALVAVLAEIRDDGTRRVGMNARAASAIACGLALLAAFAILAVAGRWGDRLPMLSEAGNWTPLNAVINYGGVVVLLACVALILLAIGPRNDLFLWLCIALAAMALGNILSAAGGGRYTVGWYACRLSWAASACLMLLYFMNQFVRQHGLLVRTTDDL